MKFLNRLQRIEEVADDGNELVDWVHTRGINGESELLWDLLKDKVPLRANLDDKADLSGWCQAVYEELVPNKHKLRTAAGNRYVSCQSAARLKEPYAVMLCTLLRWLVRNPDRVLTKLKEDNPALKI